MSGILETLIEALNKNTEALLAKAEVTSTASAAAEPAATTKPAAGTKKTTTKVEKIVPKYSVDEVNAAAVAVKEKFNSGAASALIKEHGKADKLKDIKPENYDAFVEACEKELAEEAVEVEDDL